MKNTYRELAKQIIEAVRERAKTVTRFVESEQGCVKVSAYAYCQAADDWMDGFANFDDQKKPDIFDYGISGPIVFGGDCVAVFENDDGSKDIVDTFAMTEMKIASLSYDQDNGGGLLSGVKKNDELKPGNGFAPYKGALLVRVLTNQDIKKPKPYCGIYVSVSGASEAEDLTCALAAVDVIKKFFDDDCEGFYTFDTPDLRALFK